MTEKDPIEQMMNQIKEMMELIDRNKLGAPEGPLPEGIDEAMSLLELQVALFKEATEEAMKELGMDIKDVERKALNPPETLPPKERKMLVKMTHLRKEVKAIQRELGIMVGQTAESKGETKPGEQAKVIVKHKKRYKRMGGDEKWKRI